LVSFATGLSVVTLNIHHRGMRGRELPRYLRIFIFKYLARVLCLRLNLPVREEPLPLQTDDATGSRLSGASQQYCRRHNRMVKVAEANLNFRHVD